MYYVGIDPGSSSGAIVVLSDAVGGWGVGVTDVLEITKQTDRDLRTFFERMSQVDSGCYVMIEKVGGMPTDGGHRAFVFGDSTGFIRGLLVAFNIPFERVLPRTWQKSFGIAPRKKSGRKTIETRNVFKKRCRQCAEELFPNDKVKTNTADAYLIALYGLRKFKSELKGLVQNDEKDT